MSKIEANKTGPDNPSQGQELNNTSKRLSRTSERKSNKVSKSGVTPITRPKDIKEQIAVQNIDKPNIPSLKTVVVRLTQVDRTDKWIDKFDSPPMIWINDDEQQMVWTILGPEKDFKGIAENDDVSVDNDASKHSTEEGVKVDIREKNWC